MRVLLTGHKGYVGTVLLPMLQEAGHEVVGLDTDYYSGSTFGEEEQPLEFKEIIKDIRDIQESDLVGFDGSPSFSRTFQ